ncbi:DNA-processing protein DprA [Escherichia coli]|nr:DNA-processing protein DprA [Escherichia coli]MEA1096153.1 DNA-processing protein DprA [Escherichia coli]
MGRLFCETLATRGVTITSGLARGIDGVAHKAALQVNGVSIAVLGNGLNTIHRVVARPDWLPCLYRRLLWWWLLVSEFSPRCSSPCLQFPTKKSHYQWSK